MPNFRFKEGNKCQVKSVKRLATLHIIVDLQNTKGKEKKNLKSVRQQGSQCKTQLILGGVLPQNSYGSESEKEEEKEGGEKEEKE